MITLPTEKTKIETDLSKYTIFIYGREKIGKTSLAAQFPDACFLMFEPGAKSLEIYRIDINSWTEFVEAIKLLKASKKFKTIVIDTVDIAFKYCSDYFCKKLAITHPSEEDWGKAYAMIKDEFQTWLSILSKLDRGIILLSHAQDREVKRLEGTFDQANPTLSKQGRGVVEPMVDIWGYYFYLNKERYLQIRGNEEVAAGCRLTENFIGINKISMGNSSREAYKNFISAFENKKGGEAIVKPKLIIRKR